MSTVFPIYYPRNSINVGIFILDEKLMATCFLLQAFRKLRKISIIPKLFLHIPEMQKFEWKYFNFLLINFAIKLDKIFQTSLIWCKLYLWNSDILKINN
ncbi:hypothetical protein BpHYR1_018511 [Brachionus plicatilis]|uniref:Uncharacterized protein n=1 Tax=Brachionus plicatilis TaxID=10195 RepID=A0A3M7P2M2_BRAPC|nr:hypothetical protein BpHYR1_018511 [Brachionus plicatilis]